MAATITSNPGGRTYSGSICVGIVWEDNTISSWVLYFCHLLNTTNNSNYFGLWCDRDRSTGTTARFLLMDQRSVANRHCYNRKKNKYNRKPFVISEKKLLIWYVVSSILSRHCLYKYRITYRYIFVPIDCGNIIDYIVFLGQRLQSSSSFPPQVWRELGPRRRPARTSTGSRGHDYRPTTNTRVKTKLHAHGYFKGYVMVALDYIKASSRASPRHPEAILRLPYLLGRH